MEWTPVTGYENGMDMNDRPRKLTQQEIQYVIDHIPRAPSADVTAAEISRQGVVDWVVSKLRDVQLCPSAIPAVIARIVSEHQKSLVSPGTTVGILAGEAVGATTTQMTLNTFHASGSSKSASFGIEAMRDLMFARKNPKNESSTIYFTNNRITFEEVLESRRYIVGSSVKDFVKDYDIDSPDVLPQYWWHATAETVLDKNIPPATRVMRLFLNVAEMYRHKVTIADLASTLEREAPPSLVAVYGPISDGIIDLYPHRAIIAETLKDREKGIVPPELAELTYLETVVWPELPNIRVKGISGIRKLYPLVSPVWRMVILERKITESDMDSPELRAVLEPYLGNAWMLVYNEDVMTFSGLQPENLAALCSLAGMSIIGGTETALIVAMPDTKYRTQGGSFARKIDDVMYRKITTPVMYVDQNGDFFNEAPAEITSVYRKVSPADLNEVNGQIIETVESGIQTQVLRDEIVNQDNGDVFVKVYSSRVVDGEVYERADHLPFKFTELKPNELVNQKVAEDKAAVKLETKRLTDELLLAAQNLPEPQRTALIRTPIVVPRTKIMEAAEFVIAETDGSNLKELLALPGIDKTRTTCNNMYTIASTLGIEAARTFLIRAIKDTIANTGSYVNPANILLIAEFITSRGEPYGATYTGISRQPGGHLSLATVERAGGVFMQNALHGRSEDIRGVSASVAVGARMSIGNGAFDVAQNIVENGVQRTVINDDLFDILRNDDATQALVKERLLAAPEQLGVADIAEGLDDLKTITLGGTFDYAGADNEANMLTLFNPGEIIADVAGARTGQQGEAKKVVKRVAQTTEPVVPRELIDALNLIKIGVPTETKEMKFEIKPLETGVTKAPVPTTPIVSTAVMLLTDINIIPQDNNIPAELAALLGEPVTVVTELPRVEIPALPALTGINLRRAAIEARKEQVRDLKPINIEALQEEL